MINVERPPAYFVADAPSIDFLNTFSTTNSVLTEWLADGKDLLHWLTESDLVSRPVLDSLQAKAMPGELDAVAAQARALREWFRRFLEERRGRPLSSQALSDLEPLNRMLSRDVEFGQVVTRPGNGHEFAWTLQRPWQSADALLFPIARTMADLICNDDFTHIRVCEGAGCELLFIDRTRVRNRRWCMMSLCGNRAKQVAHRQRHQHA